MSAVERFATDVDDTTGSVLGAAPDVVEVRRNGGLAALIGAVASAVAIAYLGRAVQTGATLDWVIFAVMALVGGVWLHAFVDARTPLMVADSQGVRLRLGKAWRGLPWGALAAVEHTPRRGLLRDGKLVLVPHNPDRVRAELDGPGRRQSLISEKLYGAPLALPLGLTTRVPGLTEDLTTALRQLAGGATRVVEPEPVVEDELDGSDESAVEAADEQTEDHAHPSSYDETPQVALEDEADQDDDTDREPLGSRMATAFGAFKAGLADRVAGRREARADEDAAFDDEELTQPLVASATPSPLRDPAPVARVEIRSNPGLRVEGATARDTADDETSGELPEGRELRRQGSVPLVEENSVWGDRVRPIATMKHNIEPLVIDDFTVEPAVEPVIGPEITAARTRIGLTVDALAERTRIRPHVIESIEVDDFVPCGGDFYARGHLRTLSRVLGLEVAPLLTAYDERYANAPINPRKVFEADLATGSSGGIRSTRGGPNWSILIAAIMTLVLAWSIARLIMDTPVELQSPAPILNGSDGPNQTAPTVENVTLKVTADGSAHLKVRNGKGKLIFDQDVVYGDVHRIDVLAPVRVEASDGGAIDVEIDGKERGALGPDGKATNKTYRVQN